MRPKKMGPQQICATGYRTTKNPTLHEANKKATKETFLFLVFPILEDTTVVLD